MAAPIRNQSAASLILIVDEFRIKTLFISPTGLSNLQLDKSILLFLSSIKCTFSFSFLPFFTFSSLLLKLFPVISRGFFYYYLIVPFFCS